jgi:hypothetical protein
MKSVTILLLTLLTSLSVFATAQHPDYIIYKGKEYSMHSNPMEEYFEKYPDKRPKGGIMSTGLWRGYIATFEVADGQVFLKDIQIQVWDSAAKKAAYDIKLVSVLKNVFPDQTTIKVDWLSGLLVIPHGEMIHYVHMGYGSTFEHYILLEVEKGDLKKEKNFGYKEYEKFRNRQFEAFKKTDEYKKLKEKLKKEGDSDKFIDGFLKGYIVNYTSRFLVD